MRSLLFFLGVCASGTIDRVEGDARLVVLGRDGVHVIAARELSPGSAAPREGDRVGRAGDRCVLLGRATGLEVRVRELQRRLSRGSVR